MYVCVYRWNDIKNLKVSLIKNTACNHVTFQLQSRFALYTTETSSEEASAIETTLRRAAARRSLIYGSGAEFDGFLTRNFKLKNVFVIG